MKIQILDADWFVSSEKVAVSDLSPNPRIFSSSARKRDQVFWIEKVETGIHGPPVDENGNWNGWSVASLFIVEKGRSSRIFHKM